MYPARGAPTTEAGPRLELERRADAADMSIAAGIGVAAVEHDRRRPVETMRDANADARLTLVETCIDRQRGLAGGRGHQPRGERRSRRDAPPRLDPIGVDLALQAGGNARELAKGRGVGRVDAGRDVGQPPLVAGRAEPDGDSICRGCLSALAEGRGTGGAGRGSLADGRGLIGGGRRAMTDRGGVHAGGITRLSEGHRLVARCDCAGRDGGRAEPGRLRRR